MTTKPRLLLVEYTPSILRLYHEVLKRLDVDLIDAQTGAQALQVLVQERVIRRVLEGDRPVKVGPMLRALNRFPMLQRIPARLVGVGLRPEHVAVG